MIDCNALKNNIYKIKLQKRDSIYEKKFLIRSIIINILY